MKSKTTSGVVAFLSDTTLARRFSVSRATIWRWTKNGLFPKPVLLSPGCTRWEVKDIEEWEANARAKTSITTNEEKSVDGRPVDQQSPQY